MMTSAIARAATPVWRRIGMFGFVFFLAKGLLWLIAPAALYLLA